MKNLKARVWLIKENKMAVPSSINFNKGYGGALEIFVDNPKYHPYRDIVENPNSDVQPFFTYINHSLDVHKEANDGDDFVLMLCTEIKDVNKQLIYDGDIIELTPNTENRIEGEVYYNQVEYFTGNICGWRIRNGSYTRKITMNWIHNSKVRVVGNIYENPEILINQKL